MHDLPVTAADLAANIASEHYFTAAEGVIGAFAAEDRAKGGNGTCPATVFDLGAPLNDLTICVLVLHNGFILIGESASSGPDNFMSRMVARSNAVQKMWPLMRYALKQKLHEAG